MFKKLRGRKLIEVRRRHVRILDAAGLEQLL
jgi:hypothetical protein